MNGHCPQQNTRKSNAALFSKLLNIFVGARTTQDSGVQDPEWLPETRRNHVCRPTSLDLQSFLFLSGELLAGLIHHNRRELPRSCAEFPLRLLTHLTLPITHIPPGQLTAKNDRDEDLLQVSAYRHAAPDTRLGKQSGLGLGMRRLVERLLACCLASLISANCLSEIR